MGREGGKGGEGPTRGDPPAVPHRHPQVVHQPIPVVLQIFNPPDEVDRHRATARRGVAAQVEIASNS